ncbi:MAG TPA: hypothetical protein VE956_13620 [Nodularia sp. (in: cyanobacteria)]|nr:hypothetical protein [Nodularia sp. (in: cyanobacteria)]
MLDVNGKIKTKIGVIEPNTQFFSRTIGVLISSQSANPNWYAAGELFQAYLVSFGSAGYAEGESIRTTLNRYRIYKFNEFPFIDGQTRYLLSFSPKYYLKDIRLEVWEYMGINTGVSNEDLESSVKQVQSRVIQEAASIKQLLNKINNKL